MALFLIGLGLHDEYGLTLRGLELAKGAHEIYLDTYTNKMYINMKNLEKLTGKRVHLAKRHHLEEGIDYLIEKARKKDVAILVPGDCFTATTHQSIRVEAVKKGVEVKVVPGVSVFTAAAGLSGLQSYKFGPPVTVPLNVFSRRVYDVIKGNRERGLHTLILLDANVEEERYMTIPEGLKRLLKLEREIKGGVINERDLVIGLARLGSEDADLKIGEIRELINLDFGPPPYTIIYPGELHFLEKEFVAMYKL